MSKIEKFGFTVKQHRDGGWMVHLPHQCDAWDIAGEYDHEGVPQAEAVAALERFLAEGAEALAIVSAPASANFNPAYRVARCGQRSAHSAHVMEHGPDQPRNCPGGQAI